MPCKLDSTEYARSFQTKPKPALTRLSSFEKSKRCDDKLQTTVTNFDENNRLHFDSSKQNYYFISLSAIVKITFTTVHLEIEKESRRFVGNPR